MNKDAEVEGVVPGSVEDPIKKAKSFMFWSFLVGIVLAVMVAFGYYASVKINGEKWTSSDTFHVLTLFGSVAFAFPMLTSSVRLLFFTLTLGYRGSQNSDKVAKTFETIRLESVPIITKAKEVMEASGPIITKTKEVMDKAGPMIESFDVILQKTKAMADDIVEIAHRVRTATEAMNGSFNVKTLEEKLTQVADSLNVIAGIFKPLTKTGAAMLPSLSSMIPEFDPLKAGGKRKV